MEITITQEVNSSFLCNLITSPIQSTEDSFVQEVVYASGGSLVSGSTLVFKVWHILETGGTFDFIFTSVGGIFTVQKEELDQIATITITAPNYIVDSPFSKFCNLTFTYSSSDGTISTKQIICKFNYTIQS